MFVQAIFLSLIIPASLAIETVDRSHLFQDRSHVKRQGGYPTADVAGPTPKQAWVDAYQKVKTRGLIPNLTPSTYNKASGAITYPQGTDLNKYCSWTQNQCFNNDIYQAPDGTIGISFDDGPQLPSPTLYKFLKANAIKATHFMIGSRILDNQAIFQSAIANGDNIAVHTWSHPPMTSMTDLQVLGEIGWCLQIIYDYGGGRIPAFWRPPYGDVDNRVRAIVSQVFGLTTVIWNHDTNDWCLEDNGQSTCTNANGITSDVQLNTELTKWIDGPKSPGLVILEHELSNRAVQGFINAYPQMVSNGWKISNIPDLNGTAWYQNAADDSTPVSSMAIGLGRGVAVANATLAASASAPAASLNATFASPTVAGKAANATSASASSSSATPSASASAKVGSASALNVGMELALGGVVGALAFFSIA